MSGLFKFQEKKGELGFLGVGIYVIAHRFSKFSMTSLEIIGSWSCSLQCLKMQLGQPFRRTSFSLLRSASHRLLDISAVCRIF